MKPLAQRKQARADAKVEAAKISIVAEILRNPGIAIPKPEAATDTPALRAAADKEMLERIASGELVVIEKKALEKLKKRVDEAENAHAELAKELAAGKGKKAAAVAPAAAPAAAWTPNKPTGE